MAARYWWGNADLKPVRGYEDKRCGGRHGGAFERNKANWLFAKGPKRKGRYPDAVARCRYCYDPIKGIAAEHFPKELAEATDKPRSQRTRSAAQAKTTWRNADAAPATPAARRAAAARKRSTVVDRRTPGARKGRHSAG